MTWNQAILEAYASVPPGVVILHTLALDHASLPAPIYLVQDRQDWLLKLETGVTKLFERCAFRFNLPTSSDEGLQELNIAIDNVGERVAAFVRGVASNPAPVRVEYRAYLNTDTEAPQNEDPLVLFLTDLRMTAMEVTGRAAFADVINKPFLEQLYTTERFPGLA